MVGLGKGIIYSYKVGLNMELYISAISTRAAGSKSLDLYDGRIMKRDFKLKFYVNHLHKSPSRRPPLRPLSPSSYSHRSTYQKTL
ncbi:unnamed protein product [Linum tenue]|uniref:Uncharacterized protein n=1 Tax=Linum tenue TaxID=586396 RepID=A0AAV0LHS2_9ROSI|nr:unnamed protein product [Linum tenue]